MKLSQINFPYNCFSVWKSLTYVARCVIWNSLMAWPDWPWPPYFLFYDRYATVAVWVDFTSAVSSAHTASVTASAEMMHVYTVADMDVNVAFPYIFDTGIVMKDVVFARGWNEIGVISGSCRPGMGNRTDVLHQLHNFTSAFCRLATDLLQRYHQMMVPRPAQYLFPLALLPVPAWWQILCFQSEYPRGQLPRTDSPGIASGGSYSWIWTGRPLSVGLFPLPVGPRQRRRTPTRQSTC